MKHFLVELTMTNVKIADKCRFNIRVFAELARNIGMQVQTSYRLFVQNFFKISYNIPIGFPFTSSIKQVCCSLQAIPDVTN